MREQYRGVKEDGSLTLGTLSLNSNNRKERESILKEYLNLSGAVKLVKVHDGEMVCYVEVNL